MKNIKRKFEEDPMFAVMVVLGSAYAVAAVLNATSKVIGSSGYALHAVKR